MNNVIHPEEETWAATEVITKALSSDSPLRESLQTIRYNDHYIGKMIRSIKIGLQYQNSGKARLLYPKLYYVASGFNKKVSTRVIKYGYYLFLNY